MPHHWNTFHNEKYRFNVRSILSADQTFPRHNKKLKVLTLSKYDFKSILYSLSAWSFVEPLQFSFYLRKMQRWTSEVFFLVHFFFNFINVIKQVDACFWEFRFFPLFNLEKGVSTDITRVFKFTHRFSIPSCKSPMFEWVEWKMRKFHLKLVTISTNNGITYVLPNEMNSYAVRSFTSK